MTPTPRGRFEVLMKSITSEGSSSVFIEGYASTPDPDRGDDVVLPTAFAKSLELYMANPQLLWDHGRDPIYGNRPVGQVLEAHADQKGLRIRAEVTDPVIAGHVQRGELRTLSFGYEIPEEGSAWQEVEGKALRVITQLDLYEISIVSVPMNPQARFSLAKSIKAYFKATEKAAPVDASADGTNATKDTPVNSPPPAPMDDEKPETAAPVTEEVAAPAAEPPACACPEGACTCGAPEADAPAEETPPAPQDTPAETPAETEGGTDTAEATPPSDGKGVEETNAPTPEVVAPEAPVAEEQPEEAKAVEEEPVAEEPATPVETPLPAEPSVEVQAAEEKAVRLESQLAEAAEKAAARDAEVQRLTAEMAKADTALALLTDRLLKLEASYKALPVQRPYAVAQFPAEKAEKRAPRDLGFRIVQD